MRHVSDPWGTTSLRIRKGRRFAIYDLSQFVSGARTAFRMSLQRRIHSRHSVACYDIYEPGFDPAGSYASTVLAL